MDKEHIYLKIQEIETDLDLLRNKHVHELEKIPGNPKCSTLANRIQDKLDYIVSAYDELTEHQEKAADREQFDLLSGMLTRLASEIADLSKKQPDGLVNAFKVGQINRVLKPLKEIMADEPSAAFLDLVAEVEDRAEKSRNSYSDVAVILSQFREACGEYRSKHYDTGWDIRL
jgi:DNA-binding transcriptional MocR family regulator